jgi:hypothetical protein
MRAPQTHPDMGKKKNAIRRLMDEEKDVNSHSERSGIT